MQKLPETVISSASNTYAKKRKRLGILGTANLAASNGHLHILEYLVERKYDQFDVLACRNAAMDGHLDCLKYLRETAKAPWDIGAYTTRTRTTTPNVYNTSSTTTVHYQPVGDTSMENCTHRNHHLNHHKHIHLTYLLYSTLIRIFFTRFPSDTHPTQQKGDTIRE